MAKHSQYLKRDCDICGFTYYANELIKQNGLWKCTQNQCYNQPPPSTKSLGGEGDNVGDPRVTAFTMANLAQPTENILTKYTVTDSSNVKIDTTVPYLVLQGSVTLASYTVSN